MPPERSPGDKTGGTGSAQERDAVMAGRFGVCGGNGCARRGASGGESCGYRPYMRGVWGQTYVTATDRDLSPDGDPSDTEQLWQKLWLSTQANLAEPP